MALLGKSSPPSPPPRWRIIALALCTAITLSAAFTSGTAVATSNVERQLQHMVNQARGANGLNGLQLSQRMSQRAHNHSEQMASSNTLYHSNAGRMSENIGVGGSLQEVHDALMESSSHRDNILAAGKHRVGVGVVRRDGRVWVTELFAD